MLVLALQFSKGGRRGHTCDMIVARGTPRAAGAALRAIAEVTTLRVDSLKTEEKTKLVEPACQEDESYD